MSINDVINANIDAGRLHRIEVIHGDPVGRTMVVSNDINEFLNGPWENGSMENRANRLLADLQAFVKGDVIAVALTPYEHKTAFMGRLDKPEQEIWDVRSRDPNPGLRIFGRFADVDCFVGFVWRPRSIEWAGRRSLGDKNSLEWEFEKLECEKQWDDLFPNNQPIHGVQASDYISENVISV